MFSRYFQQELENLRDLGQAFSQAHPAVAPMLSGAAADPDVERLLEGVAFLTALLREKLDDEFPEIVHELIQMIWPHYLRPIPATTIVAFQPKPALKQSMKIPAGISLKSAPIEGTACTFRTAYDVDIHPLTLLDAALDESAGHPPTIRLELKLDGMKLDEWQPGALRFFLSDSFAGAADLSMILQRHTKKITISSPDGGRPVFLEPDALRPVGFSLEEGLIPYPSNSFPGYRILQEYFILPEKFLFLELAGWEKWAERGDGSRVEIVFELDQASIPFPRVRKESFVLYATPVVNIFSHEADPIRLDHRKTSYLVRPAGTNVDHYQVYSLKNVVGYVQGTAEERIYLPFDLFHREQGDFSVYHVKLRKAPIAEGIDVFLSVAYPPQGSIPRAETLSIELLCTNGALPENLQPGDICEPTSSSPEFVTFRDIRPVTPNVLPPLGTNLLWQLLGHLSLNFLSLTTAENLKALLELYIFSESRDRPTVLANQKRLNGIEAVSTVQKDRIVNGAIIRGQEIELGMRQDHFAGPGDLFLFGSILDQFLGAYATINTYTRLSIHESIKGETFLWPPRLGNHTLI
ncbi:MAG: type VI secretion system baseplate subunit TssF [Deltaproteobacteria bacterium]|nr:type VI secretion system baseplate subunit TssF [Deltaproteobacteria bacterium]